MKARTTRHWGVTRLVTILAAFVMVASLASPAAGAQPDPPTVRVDPGAVSAGADIAIAGTGFVDDDCVELRLTNTADERVLMSATPDDSGEFTVIATIPEDAEPGAYTLVATGLQIGFEFCVNESGNAAETRLVVQDPSELEPRFVPTKPTYEAPLPDGFSSTQLHLKFTQGTDIRLDDGELVSASGIDLAEVQTALDAVEEMSIARLFGSRTVDELEREKARLEARSGQEQGDKNLYYLLSFADRTDRVALLNQLNALDVVELAYPIGEDPPPPNHADYQPFQGYRLAAGSGIHADAANSVPGGRGQNVQVIDIEGAFVVGHEDLPAVTVYPNEPMFTGARWVNHGTAVMGVLFGVDNGFGVLGLVPDAAAGFVPHGNSRADAIDVAAANSAAGDVILLEMQTTGANGGCDSTSQVGCVPQEFQQASYDAVVAAVAAGVIVVAAAGNGSQNLDSAAYDPTFGTRPDSGAIIVGAGAAGSDDDQTSVGNQNGPTCRNPERGRLNFSTFGSRVNLQGWGECVMTTGYGNVEGSSMSTDSYRATFNGTSSASPIVAGAAAIVSSVAQQMGDADGLTSTEARSLLVATGTPQDTGPGALAGNIGPLPNLAAALGLEADVSITKTADADSFVAGESGSFEITVTNNGPNIATDVVVTDVLPPEVELAGVVADCSHAASELTCDLGTLAVGESVIITVPVDIAPSVVHDAGGPLTVTNMVAVESTMADPNLTNNTDHVDVAIVAVADLQVVSTSVVTSPIEALIGAPFSVTVHSALANGGPSSPMSADQTTIANPTSGLSVTPLSAGIEVPALAMGSPVETNADFTIECTEPGVHSVTFTTSIAPMSALDTDPDLSNNEAADGFDIECLVPIAINVRPGNQFNRVNIVGQGKVPVAALTTEAGEYGLPWAFDATTIVVDSVVFGHPAEVNNGTGGAPSTGPVHMLDSFELDDKTKDGDDDTRMSFVASATDLVAGDNEACMRGHYLDGGISYTFVGCDAVSVN